ncbi:MAG: molybdopterin molybdotransferase MoeA [Planctomycetota bacterium]
MDQILSLAAARQAVLDALSGLLPGEIVPLAAALGRTLHADLRAPGPWPATDRSAMDGFAVQAGAAGLAAGTRLPVVGRALAGHPLDRELAAGQAIRIMTGAVVPVGADAVVPVEETDGFGGETVTLGAAVRRGQHVRTLGSEVAAGDLLVARGTRLRAAEVGVLAVLGRAEVDVFVAPRVAVLATGDEVVDIGVEPLPHQVRNSNAHALAAQVQESGGAVLDLGIARDDVEDLRERLARGLGAADVLLTIGGVSKGTHDLVHGTLAELGVRPIFHGIRLKPGKPTFFGTLESEARRRYVFGLPGNPASCFTVFDLLVRPLLRALVGGAEAPFTAVRAGSAPKQNAREQAVPARWETDAEGHACAALDVVRPSGDPFALLAGDGYALLAAGSEPGNQRLVPFVPYAAHAKS